MILMEERNLDLVICGDITEWTLSANLTAALINDSYLNEERAYSISDGAILTVEERAKNLLLYSDLELQSIADYLCFASSSHFGREFKEETGVMPSEYRRKAKEHEKPPACIPLFQMACILWCTPWA